MFYRTGLLIFLSCFLLSLVSSDDEPLSAEFSAQLAAYAWNHPQEKVYIHTDKPYYVSSDVIWFKAYLMVGPYQVPDSLSSVLYVELIGSDEKLIDRKIIRMREGLGYGDFTLSENTKPDRYLLKAYTNFMRNYDEAFYFRKWIDIIPPHQGKQNRMSGPEGFPLNTKSGSPGKQAEGKAPFNLTFFPEGGDMVENLQSIVAFKATGQTGRGIAIEGSIKDSNGEEIAKLAVKKFGMGTFLLNPRPDEKYSAWIRYQGQEYSFPLPPAQKTGYVMHINKVGDNVLMWVRNNMGETMKNTFIIGQFRGFPFITIQAKPDQDFLYSVVNTRELPSGIIQFTFFDASGIPKCERLVYTENSSEKIDFRIHSNKETYNKRENTDFYIECTDQNNKPILTNISISITNVDIVPHDRNRSQILSYFNFESDLRGTVENPGYYFNPDNKDRLELMDNLLKTHGWRRFVWKEVLEEKQPDLHYPAETGFNIDGQLVDFYHQTRFQPGFVRLFIFENKFYYTEAKTDAEGRFGFGGMDIFDSTQVVLQAWREKPGGKKIRPNKAPKTKNDLAIKVDPITYAPVNTEYWPVKFRDTVDYHPIIQQNDFILKLDSSFGERTIILDELLVQDTKIEEVDPYDRPGKLYRDPSNRIEMDSIPKVDQSLYLFDLIAKYVPGINFRGTPPDLQIIIRGPKTLTGSTQPLILLDGIPTEINYMYYFPVTDVAFIDVLKGGRAAIYGARGGNGVIAVFSRSEPLQAPEEGRKGVTNFVHPGYYVAREFYTPDYDAGDEKRVKPDYRRTLYWNPTLTTDEQGLITFSFFTSDETADYCARVEGMTYSGIPVVRDYYFSVK